MQMKAETSGYIKIAFHFSAELCTVTSDIISHTLGCHTLFLMHNNLKENTSTVQYMMHHTTISLSSIYNILMLFFFFYLIHSALHVFSTSQSIQHYSVASDSSSLTMWNPLDNSGGLKHNVIGSTEKPGLG